MDLSLSSRFKNAWNAFRNRAPTMMSQNIGSGYSYRPDRFRLTRGNERSIVTSVYNRIALDVAAINIQHVQLDDEGRFLNVIKSGLNECLSLEANLDQTGRAFIQDVVMSMMDEGCVAIVPVDTDDDPDDTKGYQILSMRVGRIRDWYPRHVRVEVYNENTGRKQEIVVPKDTVAIVENPLYAVINEPNSTMQRLIRKLNLLDAVDEQSSSGKLDLIIQLPYVIKSEARRHQAEQRRKDIEQQLSGSKYGIAYTDADQEEILKLAKTSQVGTFQTALEIYANENALQHDALASGFAQTGDGNVTLLFPEYKDVRPGAPELITNDQGWITTVMNKVHKSPISRIRTSQVDIRNIDALKAKGYTKGKQKKQTGNFKLVRRTTDPQTVYVKSALHRDDIIDITDFDYVAYLYNIDRLMLNEELATAIMLGDGRDDGDEGKISPDHIRPIWLDDDLYTIHVDLDVAAAKKELQGTNTAANFGENYIIAEAMINTVLYAREDYKGTGTPDLFITPHMLNQMLLARDINGRRIYSSKTELATALNVGSINTAEQFEGKTRTTSDSKKKKLVAIIANLADYSLGATKGGEVTHFTQFDIDFNQEKSLLETRCSGALTRVYSAIAIEEDVTTASSGSEDHTA